MGSIAAAAAGAAGGGGMAGAAQGVLQHKAAKGNQAAQLGQQYLRREEVGTNPQSGGVQMFGPGGNPLQSAMGRLGQAQNLSPEQRSGATNLLTGVYQ